MNDWKRNRTKSNRVNGMKSSRFKRKLMGITDTTKPRQSGILVPWRTQSGMLVSWRIRSGMLVLERLDCPLREAEKVHKEERKVGRFAITSFS